MNIVENNHFLTKNIKLLFNVTQMQNNATLDVNKSTQIIHRSESLTAWEMHQVTTAEKSVCICGQKLLRCYIAYAKKQ